VLDGLGFRKEDWARRTEEFSAAGRCASRWRSFCSKSRIWLLLDEPTNHLDLEARKLAGDLSRQLSVRLRADLARSLLPGVTVNRTVEIWNKKVQFYSGNYESYLRQKEERRSQLESAYRNQRERIEQLEAFINRFRAQATKPSRCSRASRSWKRSSGSRCRPTRGPFIFRSRKPKAERTDRR